MNGCERESIQLFSIESQVQAQDGQTAQKIGTQISFKAGNMV